MESLKDKIDRASGSYAQLSLVAFYGKRSNIYKQIIADLQRQIKDVCSDCFEERIIEQVHATVIDCTEGFIKARVEGKNLMRVLSRIVDVVVSELDSGKKFHFLSKDDVGAKSLPSNRVIKSACYISDDIVVAAGVSNPNSGFDLGKLRSLLEGESGRHKYVTRDQVNDPVLYANIGKVVGECKQCASAISDAVSPFKSEFVLSGDEISFVFHESPEMFVSSSLEIAIREFGNA